MGDTSYPSSSSDYINNLPIDYVGVGLTPGQMGFIPIKTNSSIHKSHPETSVLSESGCAMACYNEPSCTGYLLGGDYDGETQASIDQNGSPAPAKDCHFVDNTVNNDNSVTGSLVYMKPTGVNGLSPISPLNSPGSPSPEFNFRPVKSRQGHPKNMNSGLENPEYLSTFKHYVDTTDDDLLWACNGPNNEYQQSLSNRVNDNFNNGCNWTEWYIDPAACKLPGIVVSTNYTDKYGNNQGHWGGSDDHPYLQCSYSNLASDFILNNWQDLYNSDNIPNSLLTSAEDGNITRLQYCTTLKQTELDGTDILPNSYQSVLDACQQIPLLNTGYPDQANEVLIESALKLPTWYNIGDAGREAMNTALRSTGTNSNKKTALINTLYGTNFSDNKEIQLVNRLQDFKGHDAADLDATLSSNIDQAVAHFCTTRGSPSGSPSGSPGQNDTLCACYNAVTLGIANCKHGIPGCEDLVSIQDAINIAGPNTPQGQQLSKFFAGQNIRKYAAACSMPGETLSTANVIAYNQLTQGTYDTIIQTCAQKITVAGSVIDSSVSSACNLTASITDQKTTDTTSSNTTNNVGGGGSGSGSSPGTPWYKNTLIILGILALVFVIIVMSGSAGLVFLS